MAGTQYIEHQQLGCVVVNTRRDSRHVSARWRKGIVSVNVPYGIARADVLRILDEFSPRLLRTRPQVDYRVGQRLDFPLFSVELRRCVVPDKIIGIPRLPVSYVEIGDGVNLEMERHARGVSDMLIKIARRCAPQVLVGYARQVAARVGVAPMAWAISSGKRTLGTCNADGVISLSFMLMLLPVELMDYVVCHELAHLSEMNHSSRFHALLDRYLDGRESQLVHSLKTYRWPVFRS